MGVMSRSPLELYLTSEKRDHQNNNNIGQSPTADQPAFGNGTMDSDDAASADLSAPHSLFHDAQHSPLTANALVASDTGSVRYQGGQTAQESLVVAILAAFTTIVVAIVVYVSYQYLISRKKSPAAKVGGRVVCDRSVPYSSNLKISYSLPDIQEELKNEVFWQGNNKKVLRQTTLPSVPTRHQTFKRQLSHNLDLSNIKFSVCPIHQKDPSDVGAIKPELYHPDLVHQASVESSGPSEVECGKLHFTLRYDHDLEGLFVKLLQAKDLPAKEFSGAADPYVKIYLLPDRKKKFQSKVHRRNLNPTFNETFVFGVPYAELHSRTLQFSLYDFDRFSRHDLIGQVVLRGMLDNCDLSQEMEYIMDVLCSRQNKYNLGELMLSLCYLPTAGRLTVTIIKSRNLKAMDITGSSDPYVKVSLMCMGKRIKKKKTTVKKSTLNPVYNEALVFDVPAENIEDVNLLIKVIDYDRVGANELMGCCVIGAGCIGIGREHWLEMMDSPRKPVAQWYPLLDALPADGDLSPTECQPRHLSVGCLSVR